jgi:hypothetical protein
MNISTNPVGNYKPVVTPKNPSVTQVKQTKVEDQVKISNDEKKFFSNMYPNEKDEINDYHFYNKEGIKNGVSLGSLFDKRG